MNDILLSVVIPVYNQEKYIAQCIESVINQTYTNLDIIVVDDGSTDLSPVICDEYAKKDNRVKVIHKGNGGSVSARKAGTKAAAGQYITYIDGDDYIELDLYETAVGEIIQENKVTSDMDGTVDIYSFSLTCFYKDVENEVLKNVQPTGVYADKDLDVLKSKALYYGEIGIFGLLPSMCSKIFKKELAEYNLDNVSDDIRMGDDGACTFPAICASKKIIVNNELAGYMYRKTEIGTQTSNYSFKEFDRIENLFNVLFSAFQKRNADYMLNQLTYYLVFLFRIEMIQELANLKPSNILHKYAHLSEAKKLSWVKYMAENAEDKEIDDETWLLVKNAEKPVRLMISWYSKRFFKH